MTTAVVGRGTRELLPIRHGTGAAAAFSSSTTTTAATTATDAATAKPVRDFFLDNLGKLFLGTIALVIASLVRSSFGTSNMKAVREELEALASIDPLEIDELRQANSELTPEVFRVVMQDVYAAAKMNEGRMTYADFVRAVRQTLARVKGEGCTIGMGHLLDRVVIAAFQDKLNHEKGSKTSTTSSDSSSSSSSMSFSSDLSSDPSSHSSDDVTMPLSFWLAVLSLALNGPVPDRIRILYEVMEMQSTQTNSHSHDHNDNDNNQEYDMSRRSSSGGDANAPKVTLHDVTTMVSHLQQSCQLVPDTQVVPTETKYPTQQYQ